MMLYLLPSASIIFIWQSIFGSQTYSAPSEISGLEDFFTILPLYLLFIRKNIGIDIILLTAALTAVPKEVYEAASIDGKSGSKLRLTLIH